MSFGCIWLAGAQPSLSMMTMTTMTTCHCFFPVGASLYRLLLRLQLRFPLRLWLSLTRGSFPLLRALPTRQPSRVLPLLLPLALCLLPRPFCLPPRLLRLPPPRQFFLLLIFLWPPSSTLL
jgi:hypothetical protein